MNHQDTNVKKSTVNALIAENQQLMVILMSNVIGRRNNAERAVTPHVMALVERTAA